MNVKLAQKTDKKLIQNVTFTEETLWFYLLKPHQWTKLSFPAAVLLMHSCCPVSASIWTPGKEYSIKTSSQALAAGTAALQSTEEFKEMTVTQLLSSREAAKIICVQRADSWCQLQIPASSGKQPFNFLAERDRIDFPFQAALRKVSTHQEILKNCVKTQAKMGCNVLQSKG